MNYCAVKVKVLYKSYDPLTAIADRRLGLLEWFGWKKRGESIGYLDNTGPWKMRGTNQGG